MKKLLLLAALMLCFGFAAKAQVYKFNATDFSIKYYNEQRGQWDDWSKWEKSHMLIVMNYDAEKFTIYSKEKQEYDIYEYEETGDSDGEGGKVWSYLCVNTEGSRCRIHLRQQNDGPWQMYIDFNDVMWVYCMELK